jgi:hypothetical protein
MIINALVAFICIALFVVFCFRNFFIQLTAIKLLVDTLVLAAATLRPSDQTAFISQATAVMIAAVGSIVFFVLLASGIRRFSKSNSLDLDAEYE